MNDKELKALQAAYKAAGAINDNINHPKHYTQGDIECIDAMLSAFGEDAVQDYCLCNAFKYIWRHAFKGNAREDIAKAQWYLGKWQEIEQKGGGNAIS